MSPAVAELLGHGAEVVIFVLEHIIQSHHIAKRVGEEHVECPVLIFEHIAQRACHRRIHRTFIFQELGFRLVASLEVNAGRGDVSVLIEEGGQSVSVQSFEGNGEDGTHRIAHEGIARALHEVDDAGGRIEIGDLIVGIREDQIGVPREIGRLDVLGGQAELYTIRFH